MSKFVKNLITDHVRARLDGVHDALLVNVVGLPANATNQLRNELSSKRISLLVVKNSLASRALAGSSLERMFDGVEGSSAICWGGEDIVGLAKEVTRIAEDKRFQKMQQIGGVMDGERLTAAQVVEVSKWPSRQEQLGLLVAQILGPGATLAGQIKGPGSRLASQVKKLAEEPEGGAAEEPAAEGEAAPAAE